jgi:hypothetical protein
MKSPPWVLGISASHKNGAACLLRGDEIAVAIQEERLTRHKRHSIQGQPLVETLSDALWSMLALSLDVLILGQEKKPSVQSLFDLCPVRRDGLLRAVPPANMLGSERGRPQSYFSLDCETPWGSFERFFPCLVQEILKNMDGARSVRDIFSRLKNAGHGVSELNMIHLIIELVHCKTIDLKEPIRMNGSFSSEQGQ